MTQGIRHHFSEEQLQQARELRAGGMSWGDIGKRFGCAYETIRSRLDKGYKRVRSERYRHDSDLRLEPRTMPLAEEQRALATVPVDTRTRHARWMGDPIPGRSALDIRKRSAAPSYPRYSQNPQGREQIVLSQS